MAAESVTCRAVVAGRHGEPDVLAVRTWAVPTPAPGEIRLRVEASGISRAEPSKC